MSAFYLLQSYIKMIDFFVFTNAVIWIMCKNSSTKIKIGYESNWATVSILYRQTSWLSFNQSNFCLTRRVRMNKQTAVLLMIRK